jgi:hypothetical protein
MWAMAQKVLRQPRHDRHSVAMMIVPPVAGPRRAGGGRGARVVAGGTGA